VLVNQNGVCAIFGELRVSRCAWCALQIRNRNGCGIRCSWVHSDHQCVSLLRRGSAWYWQGARSGGRAGGCFVSVIAMCGRFVLKLTLHARPASFRWNWFLRNVFLVRTFSDPVGCRMHFRACLQLIFVDWCRLFHVPSMVNYGQMAQDRGNWKRRLDVAASEKLLEYPPPIPVREPSVGTLLPNVALPCQMQRRREQACRPLHSTALSLARATI
jgi:hypothetical protein